MGIQSTARAGMIIGPCVVLAVAAAHGGQFGRTYVHAAISASVNSDARSYSAVVQPLIRKYCIACHSTAAHKAGLDLQRFTGPPDLRKDLKSWQGVIDHLSVGDMPPRGMPQPTSAEKSRIVYWVQDFLNAEARATAGDPGDIPLRRLSNTEYNCTIRDLTGIDLQPAAEFPADGAAGEGFTNAAESLTDISPTLLSKYFAAAKDIAEHAVLLPDGFRFATGKSRREWTDENTARLRSFYANWTGPEGKLDYASYLLATIRHKADLLSGKRSIEQIATQEKLNAKYLGVLWKCLIDPAAGYPLTRIQTAWKAASEAQLPAISAEIAAWQGKLWQVARVGSYVRPVGTGYAESVSRQVVNNPEAKPDQTIHLSVKPPPGESVVTLRLSDAILTGSGNDSAILQNPRFEAPGQPPLLLKDYTRYGRAYEIDYPAIFANTSRYLTAVVESVNDQKLSIDTVSEKYGLNADLLQRWTQMLALQPYTKGSISEFPGRSFAAVNLDLLGDSVQNSNNLPAINGWHGKGEDLPVLLTNSSDKLELIPGNASPHSVMVHPNPTEFVAVVWNSPVTGAIRVNASIIHAHPACGNGVAWWLEHRRGQRAAMWDEGRIELGGSASPQGKTLLVQQGDQILLAVDAKDGDHSCDLTKIDLNLTEVGGSGHTWDLAQDIADNVLEGNPHSDKYGNRRTWSFVKGPTRSVGAGTGKTIPAGSLLDKWSAAASDPARQSEAQMLALQVQRLLAGPQPTNKNDLNRVLYDLLVSASGPLLHGVDLTKMPKLPEGGPSLGIPRSANALIGTADKLQIPKNGTLAIRLPAALVAEREFAADACVASAQNSTLVFRVSTEDPGKTIDWDGSSGVVATPDSSAYRSLISGMDEFRKCFPLYLCYPNVIPIDEVVNLKMFHREDEPLKRLFLDYKQAAILDHLWEEQLFVSRQPAAENRYLPLFIGFVTQDQPKTMVTFFEGERPTFKRRADAFEKVELAAIPGQMAALNDFTSLAYRRPLTPKEKADQAVLYRSLRARGESHEDAFRAVIARVLVSPEFLFRIEKPSLASKVSPVNDWELATRLSYFLWSSTPDAELRRLAASGKLHVPDVLDAQTRRMLKDARVRSLAIEFGAQWLHVRGFDAVNDKNERLFPTFDESLRKAISEETILFFQDLFQQDRPAINILDANYTYLNDQLAKYYAIPDVIGSKWRRVDNVQRYGRGGVLGLASVQASASGASRTSPVLRGNWVVETLLGEKIPLPPPNVPKLPEEEGAGSLTVRQEVEQHSKNPACAVCHRRMDPYGFALEHYDTIGRYREKDLGGLRIDDKAELQDGTRFEGIDGLRSYLMTRRRDQVMRLFCRRLVGYALGRSVINSDQPQIDKMEVELSRNHGVDGAVQMIVESPQFRMIRGKKEQ